MSSHLSIINSWTSPGFRENPEQRVSSLLLDPHRQQQEKNNPVVKPETQNTVRRKP
jgi:hypothetical protein